MVLYRMLNPWANINILPAVRCGAITSRKRAGCFVSGASKIMTSAHAAASAPDVTVTPSA